MCGIVGYIGHREASEIILEGLKRLEYRGYDSAGLAVLNGSGLQVRRAAGKIRDLEERLRSEPVCGVMGFGHTRWATHGRPVETNAHPHADCTGSVVVVHNGILENYLALRKSLVAQGHRFRSETDTEVIAHLVEAHMKEGRELLEAVRLALREVHGSYALGVLAESDPDRLIAAKHGAGGVIVGLGSGEAFLASDIPALLPFTRDVIVLEDGEIAEVKRDSVRLGTLANGRAAQRCPARIAWDSAMAEKGGHPHFMVKEIHEQPEAVANTIRGRVHGEGGNVFLPEANLTPGLAKRLRRVVVLACGTSHHAALLGRLMIEALARLNTEVDVASEYRYRDVLIGSETLVVAISQSGETADTLGAVKLARECGAPVLAITNVVGSALARESTGVLYTRAGPEIGVASTKTFTATLIACFLLALYLGRVREHLSAAAARAHLLPLLELPQWIEAALNLDAEVKALAEQLYPCQNFLYLGRGVQYPIALEGALKLKEISYIHAEGYAAGEMKHGPIALIDERIPVVALAPRDGSYERMLGNIEEVKARGGCVIAVCQQGDDEISRRADHVLLVPAAPAFLAPLITVLPLQLLAYHIAVLKGCDVDQPRNLAKSVTVE
jgi:glutamine---fructose-6-phosphate transaminase (isomerizing)